MLASENNALVLEGQEDSSSALLYTICPALYIIIKIQPRLAMYIVRPQ